MKKILLTFTGVCSLLFAVAQNQGNVAQMSAEQRAVSVEVPLNMVINQNPQPGTQTTNNNSVQRSATETEIGDTRYDLQTNSSIQRRILNHGNGTISAAWTYSNVNNWSTRGTGYNFFNGTTWGTAPTSEIESERTGWPNLLTTTQGAEIILAHNTLNDVVRRSERGTIGTGAWVQDNVATSEIEVWSRAATAGPNGNTIHLVGMTLPEANDGTIYPDGMDGAFLYSRSTNGGQSWDINNYQIPGTGFAYFDGFDGDSYHMDARGNTVAIVVGGLGRGVQLFKSVDNGLNWTKTDVLVSDVWFVEATSNIPDDFASSLYTSDGSVNVLIDNNGLCHVMYGGMRISNGTPGDDLLSFFPGTNQIDYWNETFPGPYPQPLVGSLDLDNSGGIELIGNAVDALGQYRFGGMASQPSAGIDANGCIYMSYTAVREDLNNGTQHYRHTYVTKTCDDGCSWTDPVDVTGASTNDFSECVHPSIARLVDSKVHIIYMSDNEPGMAVSGDEDAVVINKMIYLDEDVTEFSTVNVCPAIVVGDTLLCPGTSIDLFGHGCATGYSWAGPGIVSGGSTQTVTIDQVGTYTCTFSGTACGAVTASITVVAASGTGPTVQVAGSNLSMCNGDMSVLTATSNTSGSTYVWSNGATTASTTVMNAGTYTVTVADCNGATVESITITQPTVIPPAQIAGASTICNGATQTLEVLPVTGGSYVWSTGSNSTSTQIVAAGTYCITITNCAGSVNACFDVTTEDAPVAAINASATEVCEGEAITLTASGGATYLWSNGSATASIAPTTSGTYTVTVSNNCGDTDTEDIAVTVNPAPAQPVVTVSGSTYTATSSTGTYQWYVDGVAITNANSQTLDVSSILYFGRLITVIVTDPATGCVSEESVEVVGLNDVTGLEANTSVYPNPSNGQFEVRFGDVSGKIEIEMTNSVGQVVFTSQVLNASNHVEYVDLSGISSGVYTMTLEGESGKTSRQVVIR